MKKQTVNTFRARTRKKLGRHKKSVNKHASVKRYKGQGR